MLFNTTDKEITPARKDEKFVGRDQKRYARHIFTLVVVQSGCGQSDSLQKQYTRGALLLHPDKSEQRNLHSVWSRVVEQSFHYFTAAFEILTDDELEHASDDDGAGSLCNSPAPAPAETAPGSPSAAMHEGIRRPFADGPSAGRDGGSCDDMSMNNECNSENRRASTIRYSDDDTTLPKTVLRNDTVPLASE